MEGKFPCSRHVEQIKTLFKKGESMESRIMRLEDDREFMYSLDKTLAVQTQMLQNIAEHNKKQDARLNEMQKTNIMINDNLTELAEGQRNLNNRVGKLEDKVEENENKHTVDIREVEKTKYTDILYKFIVPAGAGAFLIYKLFELIKASM